MKNLIIITGTGFVIVVVVVSPMVEKTSPLHTVEPWFQTKPLPTLVISSSGSYTPAPFYTHTGSLVV